MRTIRSLSILLLILVFILASCAPKTRTDRARSPAARHARAAGDRCAP